MGNTNENRTEGESERRQFLAGLGSAVSGAAVTTMWPDGTTAGDDKPVAKSQRVAPTSGLAGIKELLSHNEPVTWVFTGDSITHGALHTLGWRSYPEHFAERVRWELRRMRDVVVNTGISGDRTGGILADIDWRALRFQPDVISIMFGMNDCSAGPDGRDTFRKNMNTIVDRTIAAGVIPLLNTPNTVYVKNADGRADLPAYAEIINDIATERKVALVDHWDHWKKTKPDQEELLPWLEDQRIHPGVYGHREFAKMIFRELGIFDPASPTCKLDVP